MEDQLPLNGSYTSVEPRTEPPSHPPTTSTLPSGSRVAVWPLRALAICPVGCQFEATPATIGALERRGSRIPVDGPSRVLGESDVWVHASSRHKNSQTRRSTKGIMASEERGAGVRAVCRREGWPVRTSP